MKSYRYSILAVLCLSAALVPFTVTSINLALPHIANELNLSAVALGWIVTAFLLPAAIFQIPLAKIGDMYGRKKVLLSGVVLFMVASLGCALSHTGALLIACRFVQGVASAMLFATTLAIITSVFPARERGRAFGTITAVIYFALASGPFIGGIFTHYRGWRSIFYVTISLALLTLAGILVFFKGEWRDAKDDHFDWQGSLIYAFGLSAFIYGCSLLPSIVGFGLIAAGFAGFTLFVHYEKKQTSPVFNVNMFFENRVFRMSSFAALINYSATFSVTFMLSLYLHYVKGFDAQKAGLILIIQPIFMTIFSPLAGKWSDRTKNVAVIATSGMAIMAVCLMVMVFLTAETPVSILFAIFAVLGFGYALFASPNTIIIMGSVEKRYLGMASATTGTMRVIGQSISMGITMMMIAVFVGNAPITIDNYQLFMKCMHYTFGVFSVFCLFGVYTSMSRGKT